MSAESITSITVRTLADFMTAAPSSQRRIVKTAKYPTDEESKAIVAYYRDARRIVELRFMSNGAARMGSELAALERVAATATGPRKARLLANVRAIRDFEVLEFARQPMDVHERSALLVDLGRLEVKVRPMLQLMDKGQKPLWCQLDFSEDAPSEQKAAIAAQLFLQAARAAGIDLVPSSAQYLHVHSGHCFLGGRHKARLEKQIAASCDTFADIWNSI